MRGKSGIPSWAIWGVVIVGLLYLAGGGKFPALAFGGAAAGAGGENPNAACSANGVNTYGVAIQNPDSPTLMYLAGTATFIDTAGNNQGTATGVVTLPLTYGTNAALPCGSAGTIYLASSATSTGAKAPYSADLARKNIVLLARNVSAVSVFSRNSDANDTASGGGTGGAAGVNGSTAVTLGSGGTYDGYLDLSTNITAGQFGGSDGGVIYAWSFPTSNKFSTGSGVSMSSSVIPITKLAACPTNVIVGTSAKVCFKSRAIKSSDGTARVAVHLYADLGDPATTDSPTLRILSEDYGANTDSTFSLMSYDNGGTSKTFPYISQWLYVTS